jgi:hypothetical protein
MAREYVEQRNDGYFVKDARVSLDSVVHAFLRGESPEGIAESFPSPGLEQIFGALAFSIANRGNSSGGAKTGSRKKSLKSSPWSWLLSEKPGSVDAWGLPIASIDQSHPLKTSGSWNVRTSG